ncbi:efflux RND transporter periplasmic adaptor subunit [Antarcticibacterium sp. 1MA-6-2]|uniref:efflux RND transporter periplasmic adaptor subunit n=1 Tax=Antarcticibacterium sp. 1MA-6-2 TaxID=2908210 RepID=UPI001F26EDA1|nr:efflux RND transporter periplasmic adaptor subunit [Antarcticibacterium sp. 1MA-6-2]UJH92924.1 efflux RND transporter periplasmic adaptor subunit [Antarcticibacterium sp. 1MA-6-2]
MLKINQQPFSEALNNAYANLHAAEAELLQRNLEIEKLEPLVKNEVVSPYQLKTAEATKKVAEAKLNQAKAMVSSAKINMGYTTIKAPVNGYIGRFPKKQGSIISPADVEPLTSLSDVHEVHVYFALGEKGFFRFKEKSSAANAEALPAVSLLLADGKIYPEKGKIDMIAGQFNSNTGTITLRATFSNSQGILRSGNTGKIQLDIPHENVILVPQQATVEVQDKIFVFVVDKDNVVARQPIEVTGKSGDNYLVKKGLLHGNRIVYKGFDYLVDGTVIQPEKMKKTIAKK